MHYCLWHHREWFAAGLADPGDFAECVEYVNQEEDYCDSLRGEWFYIPDEPLPCGHLVIYYGTFGNDHSPFASSYTYAETFDPTDEDEAADYARQRARWEACDEYLPTEDEGGDL